ncbi:nitrate/nitrite transporter NrtS [Crocosphaera chwakensis]|uniref:Uncharacterized protein n=1 Tax=Crocosphaera chwakensis CCY0110 TaxID=391612 RepID=A3IQT6_9CHRO|nr:nitrate/nitrite transporter NrtS [Crocosphaera chwakensis]EAZ91141.1 hypothetical protein CY0110_12777 [Crocosphaera chwakensis CCY0110]
MRFWLGFFQALFNKNLSKMAIKVALVVGSIFFTIIHGKAVMQGKMTQDCWISGLLTYCVPYIVNIQGQYVMGRRKQKKKISIN